MYHGTGGRGVLLLIVGLEAVGIHADTFMV